MSNWNSCPQDVQIDILRRVPFETLRSCLVVTKSVSSLVSSADFMFATTTPHDDPGSHLYCRHTPDPGGFKRFLVFFNVKGLFVKDREIATTMDVNCVLVGSSHGLVCFSNEVCRSSSYLLFWNPFLGNAVKAPLSVAANELEVSYALGFGFDRSCMDFKVVKIGIVPNHNTRVRADVYTLTLGNWENAVFGSVSRSISRIRGQGVFMNGVIHWLITSSSNGKSIDLYTILSFNLNSLEFKEMRVPVDLIHNHCYSETPTLTTEGQEKLVMYQNDATRRQCDIWVMEEYGVAESWSKVCTYKAMVKKVLSIWKNGEIRLSTTYGEFICYNPRKNHGNFTNYGYYGAIDYLGLLVKNLMFLDKPHFGAELLYERIRSRLKC